VRRAVGKAPSTRPLAPGSGARVMDGKANAPARDGGREASLEMREKKCCGALIRSSKGAQERSV